MGGHGGSGEWGFQVPRGYNLSSIQVVTNGECIVSVMFTTYSQEHGQRDSERYGSADVKGAGMSTHNIKLGHGELVSEISGTFGVHDNTTVITSLTFKVGTEVNGPYGKVSGTPFSLPVINGKIAGFWGNSDQYLHSLGVFLAKRVRDLPDKSKLQYGDLEWFFFCPKSRKYLSGSRTNRATEAGYWKATGKDREVKYKDKIVAAIKTLVFHAGHPPKGTRTDWVMHEYRMDDKDLANAGVIQDGYVLCRLFEKSGMGPKNGAQYGAPFEEEEWDNMDDNEVISFESSAMITADTINSNATVTNMTLTEPAQLTAISSASERLVVQVGANETLYSNARSSVVKNVMATEPGPSTVTSDYERHLVQFGATKTLNSIASSSVVTNMTSTEAGPSTVTFPQNETHLNTAANDDFLLDYELTDSILQITDTQVVEDCNGKPADAPNGDDLIFLDWEALGTLDDLSLDGFEFTAEGSAGFMADAFFADDLDDALARFV